MRSLTHIKALEKRLGRNGSGNHKHFPPQKPSLLFKAISYALVNGLITPGIGLFMNIFNRTRISGFENIKNLEPPWILASNHITLLDDLFIEPLILFPKVYKGYKYFPYHAPEERNFYKNPFAAWFMRQCKAIPVVRGNGIMQEGMNRIIDAVNQGGVLHIFPEGTRTRTGEIGAPKPGIGRIICETNAPIVPMYHQGLEKILPIGRAIPSLGYEIRISIGKPVRFNAKPEIGKEIETWKQISQNVIDAIREQREIVSKKWGHKPLKIKKQAKV